MIKQQKAALSHALAALALCVSLFAGVDAKAQMRLSPTLSPDVTISAQCESDRAIFKIRNGTRAWSEMGEIIVLAEKERRILSRRKMRFASNQFASYRVPLNGKFATEGALRIVLMSGGAAKKPIAHARLDCANS